MLLQAFIHLTLNASLMKPRMGLSLVAGNKNWGLGQAECFLDFPPNLSYTCFG
jgi:hypothetical protein